jgi:branched-chain amino acid transport system substrate-binding protein
LTGVGASAGAGIVDAAKMAADEINASGGINGKNIKVNVEDNATDPAQCTTVAQKFTSSDAVAVIGGWASSCTLAMQPITTRAQVPLVVETSSTDAITDPKKSGGDWTFRMSASSGIDTQSLANLMPKLKPKSVFLLAENTDFGLGSNAAFQAMLKSQGIKVAGSATFAEGAQSFRDQVTKAIASGADTWAVTTTVQQLAQILKEAQGQGAHAQVLAAGGSTDPDEVVKLAGAQAAEGLMTTEYFPKNDPSLAGDPKAARTFIQSWKADGKSMDVISEAARGYAAIYVLADALKNASDPTDRAAVRDALTKVDIPSIIYGHVKFGDWCGLVNQNQPTILLNQVKNGKVEHVETANPPYPCPAS